MPRYDDDTPEEAPPSYSESIAGQTTTGVVPQLPSRPTSQAPPQPPRRPSSQQSRPSKNPYISVLGHGSSILNQASSSSSNHASSSSSLYNGSNNLPFQYPRGNLCKKCKNTGFKIKNGEACRDCWAKHYLNKHAYNPNPELPFRYPKRYLCEKCNNTGKKLKNGLSCKDCWELFGPRNNVQYVSLGRTYGSHGMGLDGIFGNPMTNQSTYITSQFVSPGYGPPPGQYGPPPGQFGPPPGQFGHPPGPFGPPPGPFGPPPPGPPLRVQPGDPRIGGVLCGRCRGSGLVWMLLDEELCPSCSGLGRIVR